MRVFISYSRMDFAFADLLLDILEGSGYNGYLDRQDIVPGEAWRARLGKLILQSDAVAFVISPDSIASEVCDWEVQETLKLGKLLIPIHFRETAISKVPGDLKELNFVDARRLSEDYRPILELLKAKRAAYDGINVRGGATHAENSNLEKQVDQFRKAAAAEVYDDLNSQLVTALRVPEIEWTREHTRWVARAMEWSDAGRPESQLLRLEEAGAGREWARLRPAHAPRIPDVLTEFLTASERKENDDRTSRNRIIQSAFVEPTRKLVEEKPEAALRRLAAGAILSDDPRFELGRNLDEPNRNALWRAGAAAVDGRIRGVLVGPSPVQMTFPVSFISPTSVATFHGTVDDTANEVEARVWDASFETETKMIVGPSAFWLGILFGMHQRRRGQRHKPERLLQAWNAIATGQWEPSAELNKMKCVDLSPSCNQLLTCDLGRTLSLWEVGSNSRLFDINSERGEIAAMFLDDGERILSIDGEKGSLWDVATKQRILSLPLQVDKLAEVGFSSDFEDLIVREEDGRIYGIRTNLSNGTQPERELLIEDGNRQFPWFREPPFCLFSPDNQYAIACTSDGHLFQWRRDARAEHRVLEETRFIDRIMQFAHGGKGFLSNLGETGIGLWDATTGELSQRFEGHTGKLGGAAISPDGNRLLTWSEDRSVRLWDINSGERLSTICNDEPAVTNAFFTGCGSRIVTAISSGELKVWDGAAGSAVRIVRAPDDRGVGSLLSPTGQLAILTRQNKHWIARVDGVAHFERFNGSVGSTHVVLSPNEKLLLNYSSYGQASIWNTESRLKIANIENPKSSEIERACFSNDSSVLAVAYGSGNIGLWDASTGQLKCMLEGHTDGALGLMFDQTGKRMLSFAADKLAVVWDVASGEQLHRLEAGIDYISGARMSPDGTKVLTVSRDVEARLWLLDGPGGESVIFPHNNVYGELHFSPQGTYILSYHENKCQLWFANDIEKSHSFDTHHETVKGHSFSSDESEFVTYAASGTMRSWHAETGRQIVEMNARTHNVEGALYSLDGRLVLCWGNRSRTTIGSSLIFCARTGALLRRFDVPEGTVVAARFWNGARYIVALTGYGTLYVWDVQRLGVYSEGPGIVLAAALSMGIGQRTIAERSDLLMSGAPDDLYQALISSLEANEERSPEGKANCNESVSLGDRVAATKRRLQAKLDDRCYLAPSARDPFFVDPGEDPVSKREVMKLFPSS